MRLTREQLGGPWAWGIVRDLIEAEIGPAGEPQQWVLDGNDSVLSINGPAVAGHEAAIEAAVQDHVDAGPAAWAETRKDAVASSLNDGRDLRVAIVKVVVDEINLLRGVHGLAPRTLSQVKNAIRGKL